MSDLHDRELEDNFAYFRSRLPDLMASNADEYALIRHREIVSFHAVSLDAFLKGHELYPDGLFSVQQVRDRPVDLGFMSYATGSR